MVYFPNSIYLDPYPPQPPHLFPNTAVIKDKIDEFFFIT